MKTKNSPCLWSSVPTFCALAFAVGWAFWGPAIIAPRTAWAGIGYYSGGFAPLGALHGPDDLRLLIIMTGVLVASVLALIIASKGRWGYVYEQ